MILTTSLLHNIRKNYLHLAKNNLYFNYTKTYKQGVKMIGLIDRLSSKINFVPSQKECMKMLNEYVTHDLYTNHYSKIEHVLIGFPKNERSLSNIVENLFIKRYVNKGYNGSPTSTSISLDNILRSDLTEHFQIMQYLSSIYEYSRLNRISGK